MSADVDDSCYDDGRLWRIPLGDGWKVFNVAGAVAPPRWTMTHVSGHMQDAARQADHDLWMSFFDNPLEAIAAVGRMKALIDER